MVAAVAFIARISGQTDVCCAVTKLERIYTKVYVVCRRRRKEKERKNKKRKKKKKEKKKRKKKRERRERKKEEL